jgi:AcrR family transcriptional regulator
MPPTRPGRKRADKRAEVLDLAEAQLQEGGYAAMSVAAIARKLRIAPNTVYWYFPSKDHLFIAVLERLMLRTVQAKPPHDAGIVKQALWFVDRMSAMRTARVALHERAASSPMVGEFEAGFRQLLREMLMGGLRQSLPAERVEPAADAFRATVEGVLALDLPKAERDQVLTLVMENLLRPAEAVGKPAARKRRQRQGLARPRSR